MRKKLDSSEKLMAHFVHILYTFSIGTHHGFLFLVFFPAPLGKGGDGLSQFIEQKLTKSDRPELAGAKTVISGGTHSREWP